MIFFLFVLFIGFLYEYFLGAIDLKMIIDLKVSDKIKYLWLFLSNFLLRYIYGFLLKQNRMVCFAKNTYLLTVISIMKKNEIVSLQTLLDIVVVDNITNKFSGRFLINYVFLNI